MTRPIDARTSAATVRVRGQAGNHLGDDGVRAVGAMDSCSTRRSSPGLLSSPTRGAASTTVTSARKRYPRRATVSTNRGLVAERRPNPVDGFVHTVVEIDEGVGGPQAVTKLFPGNGVARALEQHRQNLKLLLLKSEPHALLPQLAGSKIQLEHAEPEADGRAGLRHEMTDR